MNDLFMAHYFEEAKNAKSGKEFVENIFGTNTDWAQWQACWWIYYEDGGKLSFAEFMKDAPKAPITYEEIKP